jgi:hypothetical protein
MISNRLIFKRVAEGITEDEGWRLFQQILDALVHMSGLGIVSMASPTYPIAVTYKHEASSRCQID